MRILYTIPGWGRHGGVRVILEHVNRLSALGHNVTLLALQRGKADWFKINPAVKISYHPNHARGIDVAVITSPHTVHWLEVIKAKKKLLFCQMAEHLFRPDDKAWVEKCKRFYSAPYPMMAISKWNLQMFADEFGRSPNYMDACTGTWHFHPLEGVYAQGSIKQVNYYIGNGVNLDDFPISNKLKDGKCILVEGWVSHNAAKDVDHIAPKVALRLRKEFGVKILAYSQMPNNTGYQPDEFYCKPDLKTMNDLYERATIMVKASKYDARSCSPVEAMTKGTVTARAIIQGDDDLIDFRHDTGNSIRQYYDEQQLYNAAKYLLEDRTDRDRLVENALKYIQTYTWDFWMNEVNKIITSL